MTASQEQSAEGLRQWGQDKVGLTTQIDSMREQCMQCTNQQEKTIKEIQELKNSQEEGTQSLKKV